MRASLESLRADVGVAIDFFVSNLDAREMPFMHSFPENACERSAALLMVALVEKYKNDRIVFVKGVSRETGAIHFWLEVNNYVVDPTAHQFPDFEKPIIGVKPHPLESVFQRHEELLDPQTSTDLPENSNCYWGAVSTALCSTISAR